jgi:hypothetical protein
MTSKRFKEALRVLAIILVTVVVAAAIIQIIRYTA